MPGAPNTLAVARGGYSGHSSAIALFDSEVQRPDTFNNQIEYASYSRLQFAHARNLYTTQPYGFENVAVTNGANAAPFRFVDPDAAQMPRRFYRAVFEY